MRTTPVDRLAHVGRLLLLLGALLAVATLGAWTLAPEWVDQVDEDLVADYVAAAEALDEELLAAARGDSEVLLGIAEQQAELLSEVRPSERMDAERRRALEYMTRHRDKLGDLEGARKVTLKVLGDGKTYQLRFSMAADGYGGRISYTAPFETQAGAWTEHTFTSEDFDPVWRGQAVPSAAPFDLEQAMGLRILIADKQAGPFALELGRATYE